MRLHGCRTYFRAPGQRGQLRRATIGTLLPPGQDVRSDAPFKGRRTGWSVPRVETLG